MHEDNLLKLNLGCGNRAIPGFINIDIESFDNTDVALDIRKVDEKFSNKCKLIYSSHVLEHFKKNEIKDLLYSWNKCLVPGGILRLAVPDFDAVVQYYKLTKDIDSIQSFLNGGQKSSLDYHFITFNFEYLKRILNEAGFHSVKIYNYQDTEHAYIDDYSQCYLPHMDKTNGMLMSLNIEAIKC